MLLIKIRCAPDPLLWELIIFVVPGDVPEVHLVAVCLQDLACLCLLPEGIICHASVCKCMCTCRVQVHVQCASACAHAGPFGVVRLVGVCKCMCNCSVHVQCASTCFAHKCVRMWVHVKCTHTHHVERSCLGQSAAEVRVGYLWDY